MCCGWQKAVLTLEVKEVVVEELHIPKKLLADHGVGEHIPSDPR